MNKKKINIVSFVWVFLAAIVFALRYIKIFNMDYDILGSTSVSFTQKLTNCGLPLVNVLDTCKNINLVNLFWWIAIAILVIIQLVVLVNKLKK